MTTRKLPSTMGKCANCGRTMHAATAIVGDLPKAWAPYGLAGLCRPCVTRSMEATPPPARPAYRRRLAARENEREREQHG